MDKLKCVVFFILSTSYFCDGYKILAVFPMPSKSHGILGDNMIKHLLAAGHEVTYVTPYMKKDVHPNLRQVDVSANRKVLNENSIDLKLIMDGVLNFQDEDVLFEIMNVLAGSTLENPNVQRLMKDTKQNFDVVIGEYMFSDLYSAFGPVFQCPFIWFSTIEPHWMILDLVDGPVNPAYSSYYINTRIAPYTFTERLHELWSQVYGLVRKGTTRYNKENDIYQRLIAPIIRAQNRTVPSYQLVKYNASLLLGNTQVVIGEAISLPQNYKHIGGYHIDDEVKPLPENLKNIMDNAKNGVIFFSLGSNIKSKDLPIEIKRNILNMFGGLKQTVLWKFEEVLPDLPKNVHIVQWAPQPGILAHPNLVLFITHGGLLSICEAVHFGVPLIAVPVFADQFMNAKRVESKGFAKKVDLSYTVHEDLKVAIDEVLGDPKYAAKAKELSRAYHDRPLKPKDELNFWVKHVVYTHGAPHLRSPALLVPLYQRVYLDLIVLLLVACIVLTAVITRILSMAMKKEYKKKEKCN